MGRIIHRIVGDRKSDGAPCSAASPGQYSTLIRKARGTDPGRNRHMKIYTLERSQDVAASPGEVWSFFSNPENLALITPPWLGFRIISGAGRKIYEGMTIKYEVSPLLGIPLTWVTGITEVEEPVRFVDEQRRGPYSFWRHEHIFKEKGGAVEVKDVISYALPLGPLGAIVHALDTRKRLGLIFDFRRSYIEGKFGAPSNDEHGGSSIL